jgi:hypothetical protein
MYALTGKVFKGWQLVASEWMLVALKHPVGINIVNTLTFFI